MIDYTRATKTDEEVLKQLDELYNYKPWDQDKIDRGREVRTALISAAMVIIDNVPPSPTRTVALRKLFEARMDCNAAITHEGRY